MSNHWIARRCLNYGYQGYEITPFNASRIAIAPSNAYLKPPTRGRSLPDCRHGERVQALLCVKTLRSLRLRGGVPGLGTDEGRDQLARHACRGCATLHSHSNRIAPKTDSKRPAGWR